MFYIEETQTQDNLFYKFKQLVLKDKIDLLQSKTTLPKKYWLEEKKIIIDCLKNKINSLKDLLRRRMQDTQHSCEFYIDHDDTIDDKNLQIFKEKWVYSMSYMMHEVIEINELKQLLHTVQNLEYQTYQEELC